MWLCDICGSGGTFSGAYSSWYSNSTAISASFRRISSRTNINRQICNDAFTHFLKLLKFPRDEDLFEIFPVRYVRQGVSMGESV